MKKIVVMLVIFALVIAGCSKKAVEEDAAGVESTTAIVEKSSGQDTSSTEYENKLTEIALKYVNAFLEEDYELMLSEFEVTIQMKSALSTETLKQITEQINSQNGSPVSVLSAKVINKDDHTIISVGVEYETNTFAWNVAFDSNGDIAGLTIGEYTQVLDKKDVPSSKVIDQVQFGEVDYPISGEIRYPDGKGPFPAVVLVHGSGPNDRYETIGPNAVFKDIAEDLTEKGIAVLVYDKRTLTHGKVMMEVGGMTVGEETVYDAQYAVELLQNQERIDSDRIFVLGHSLGGYLLPRIYRDDLNLAGVIFMAGSADPLEDLIVMQINYLAALDGKITSEEQVQIDTYSALRDGIQSETLDENTPASELMGIPASYWLDLRDYEPVEMAKKINTRILILQGDRDYQVPVDQFKQYQDALGDKAVYKLYKGLNHLMMFAKGTPGPDEYSVPNHVSEDVTNDIASFILE